MSTSNAITTRTTKSGTENGGGCASDAKSSGNGTLSRLKRAMGRYRRRGGAAADRLEDWNEFIDPGRPDEFESLYRVKVVKDVAEVIVGKESSCEYYKGPVFALQDKPGFYLAPQALDEELQRALAFAAMTEYCLEPHKTNIDGVPPKAHEVMNEPYETFWYLWKQAIGDNKNRKQQQHGPPKYRSFKKLSWATLGYHYDWTQRKYHAGAYSEVPAALQRIGRLFAKTAILLDNKESHKNDDNPHQNTPLQPPRYTVSACIVNYYSTKSVMGAHKDDLEYDMTKPVVSLCLGKRPCVFVLGGESVDDAVVPIVLRPGDVVVMGGATRLAYHAMARLLPTTLPATSTVVVPDEDRVQRTDDQALPIHAEDCQALEQFVCDHRININLRQVYPDG